VAIQVDAYLEKFRAFGEQPSLERYMLLFHPEATLFDSGMERPLTVPEIPDNIRAVLALVPDFRFEIVRWRFRDDTLFVEAANSATLAGAPIEWGSVYCMTLDGDQVRRGRRYYDRAPLFARLNPDAPAPPAFTPHAEAVPPPVKGRKLEQWVEDYTALWQRPDPARFAEFYADDGVILNPGMERPIERREIPSYYRFLLTVVPDLTMERVCWAGDDACLMIEWLGRGHAAGSPLTLPVVDRWLLHEGLASEGVAYFDSLAVVQALAGGG